MLPTPIRPDMGELGQRIVIIGGPGAGKTWLARQLGEMRGIPAHEVDAIHWGPNWQPRADDVALTEIEPIVAGKAWILDGTYRRYWPTVWPRAETLIWLDYGRLVLEWRLLRRTVPRVATGVELWNGNLETWHGAFIDGDNLFRHAWGARSRLRERVASALADPRYQHLTVIRHTSPRQTRRWLTQIEATAR